MPEKTKRFFDFGRFRVDPIERVLLADGHPVSLTLKAFETLLLLVEHSGHIVEKDELLTRVWPDTFVEEGTLVQNISCLRKILCTHRQKQNSKRWRPRELLPPTYFSISALSVRRRKNMPPPKSDILERST